MRVFVTYFSQMGRNGCGDDPTFLLAAFEKQIKSWNSKISVETKCYQAPGRWMDYLSDADEETHIGTDIYAALGSTAFDPWHELQQRYDGGEHAFLFIGASNGCVPASFFATQFSDKTLSLTLLSCVPGREQWGDIARLHCPITVTCGSDEKHFGGASSIYSFAQTVHANVFSFWGKHLFEGQDVLRRLATFVADASRPTEAPTTSPRQRKSRSPGKNNTKAKGRSPSRRRRVLGKSKGKHLKRSNSGDSRRGRSAS